MIDKIVIAITGRKNMLHLSMREYLILSLLDSVAATLASKNVYRPTAIAGIEIAGVSQDRSKRGVGAEPIKNRGMPTAAAKKKRKVRHMDILNSASARDRL